MPSRPIVLALLLLLAAVAGGPAGAQSPPPGGLTDAQAKALPGLIHDYIVAHPDILVESLRAAQRQAEIEARQEARAALAEHRDELVADPDAPVAGNPEGDVTIVEFFDYRCPYCKAMEPTLQAMVKADPNLRIVYKEYPVLGPASIYATRMALAARKQGKYQIFHDAMLSTKGQVDEALILRVARLAGIDVKRAQADMASPDIDAAIERNVELAEALKLRGTPGFVIGNAVFDGAASAEALKKYVTEAREKSG